jgi:Family of unknown function (DUF6459)
MPPSDVPAVRLVEIPDAAPPYDCETHGAGCPAAQHRSGTRVRAGNPGRRVERLAERPAAGPGAEPGRDTARGEAAGTAPAGAGPAAWPRQFAQVMVEVLAGVRPARQVAGWTTDRVRTHIGQLRPLLASDRRPRIQRIVTSRPAAHVIEMTVIASFGPRSRALAMRLEHVPARPAAPGWPGRPARWLCTAIEAG